MAIIDISGAGFRAKINVLTSHSVPYPRKVREALLAVSNTNAFSGDISRLNFLLGELYTEALQETAERAEIPVDSIKLIGCHGQTIFHEGQGPSIWAKRWQAPSRLVKLALLASGWESTLSRTSVSGIWPRGVKVRRWFLTLTTC